MKAGTHIRSSAALLAAQGSAYKHGYILGPGPVPNFSLVWWFDTGHKALMQDKWLTPMADQPRARSLFGCPPDSVLKAHDAGA